MKDKQNKIWSDILAYNPKLNLSEGKIKADYNTLTLDKSNNSVCFNNYISYNPYITIQSLKTTIEKLADLMKLIENDNDITKDSLKNILVESDEITKNSAIEVYSIIDKDKNSLSEFLERYKKTYYGSMAEKEIEEVNQNMIKTIEKYEFSGDIQKVNYTDLAFDSYLNNVIMNYSNKLYEYNSSLYSYLSIKKPQETAENNKLITEMIKDSYIENKHKKSRYYYDYLDNQNKYSMQSLFNQCINLRKKMNDSINADSDIDADCEYSDLIYELKSNITNTAFDSIEELIKGSSLILITRNKYNEAFKKCENLKTIYKNIV